MDFTAGMTGIFSEMGEFEEEEIMIKRKKICMLLLRTVASVAPVASPIHGQEMMYKNITPI